MSSSQYAGHYRKFARRLQSPAAYIASAVSAERRAESIVLLQHPFGH